MSTELDKVKELLMQALEILVKLDGGVQQTDQSKAAAPTSKPAPSRSAKSPDAAKSMKMPFGKHKGIPLWKLACDEPDYLEWALENMDALRPQLREAIETVLAMRSELDDSGEINIGDEDEVAPF